MARTKQKYKNETNPISVYSIKGKPLNSIVDAIRNDIFSRLVEESKLSSEPIEFRHGLVQRAKEEASKIIRNLDKPTFPFAQDLNDSILGVGSTVYSLMLCDGILYGADDNIKVTIPISLGNNAYQLFRRNNDKNTIDAIVTDNKVNNFFTDERRELLLGEGYTHFDILSSRFFFISEASLNPFRDSNGCIDMARLIPLMSYVPGKLFTEEKNTPIDVKIPGRIEAISNMPVFLSYRLKQTLDDKLINALSGVEPITEEDVISDWVAHRICVHDELKAYEVYEFLKKQPTLGRIGRSRIIDVPFEKDYYAKPKANGYKAIKLRVLAETRHDISLRDKSPMDKVLREIQIVDRLQYWNNEISQTSKQSRFKYDAQKKDIEGRIPKEVKARLNHYRFKVLSEVFGRGITTIDFRYSH